LDAPLPVTVPTGQLAQVEWETNLKNPAAVPVEAIEVYGPRQMFEEFVARDVPQEQGLPFVQIAVVLRQNDEGAISAVRVEPSIQNFGDVAQPSAAAGPDEVLVSKSIEILALRTSEVPSRKDRVCFADKRTLHDGE